MAHALVETMMGGGLEGCGPSQRRFADINTVSRRRRSGRPPGNRPAMAHPLVATMIGAGLEGCGPSQPLPAVNQHGFTAPTERAPSRGSPGNGPSVGGNDDRRRPGAAIAVARLLKEQQPPI